jgi:hypothetical protein
MRAFVGNHVAVNEAEFVEQAQGFDDPGDLSDGFLPALFLGVLGESDEEDRARRAAAEDILAELLRSGRSKESSDGGEPSIDSMNAAHTAACAKQLVSMTSLRSRVRGSRDGRTPKAAKAA